MRCFGVYGAAHRNLSCCLLVSRQKENNKIAIFMILSSLRVTFDIEGMLKEEKIQQTQAKQLQIFPLSQYSTFVSRRGKA